MLNPAGALLSSFNITEGSYVHAVISSSTSSPSSSFSSSSSSSSTTSSSSLLESGQQRNLAGLDTLMNEGLTVNEVAALRTYFRPSIDSFASAHESDLNMGAPLPGESQVDFRARIESAWMTAQGPMSEFYLNLPSTYRPAANEMLDDDMGIDGGSVNAMRGPNVHSMLSRLQNSRGGVDVGDDETLGTYKDMMLGFFFGIFFGFLSIICLWEANVPHRQKVGILIGVILQLLVGLLGGNQADKAQAKAQS